MDLALFKIKRKTTDAKIKAESNERGYQYSQKLDATRKLFEVASMNAECSKLMQNFNEFTNQAIFSYVQEVENVEGNNRVLADMGDWNKCLTGFLKGKLKGLLAAIQVLLTLTISLKGTTKVPIVSSSTIEAFCHVLNSTVKDVGVLNAKNNNKKKKKKRNSIGSPNSNSSSGSSNSTNSTNSLVVSNTGSQSPVLPPDHLLDKGFSSDRE